MKSHRSVYFACFFFSLLLSYCGNNPYGEFAEGKVMYTALGDDPRTLDPVRVGDTASNGIASNLHDTPYEYHYLKRPLQLYPSMATSMPRIGTAIYQGRTYDTLEFSIKKNLRYADDVCFADGKGREIKIDDIIYSMKRAGDNALDPFGMAFLIDKVVGFNEFASRIEKARIGNPDNADNAVNQILDEDVPGIQKIDDYTLRILVTEEYPQLVYFFALTVGSPSPSECVKYYNGENGRPTYDRHPVSSGAYLLQEWKPNAHIILVKNPNYRKDDFYPSEGNPGDDVLGLLKLKDTPLPIVDKVHFRIIRASPPIWTMFEQGYLDRAGIPREVFNQVIVNQDLSSEYKRMGIRLDVEYDVSTFWFVFNLTDPVIKNTKLRQALSLVLDREEMIQRFMNNRGLPAQSLIPPGMEGFFPGYKNPYSQSNLPEAKRLLEEAGYPNGVDPTTKKALKIHLALVDSPQSAATLYKFYIDSFNKVGIDLVIDQLDWPTILEQKYKKTFQMIHGGWHADYPDPVNFYQLFYSGNIANSYNEGSYRNETFDALYLRMKVMKPGPAREAILLQMHQIVQEDAPVLYLFHPVSYALSHRWVAPIRAHPIDTNQLKYRSIDEGEREKSVEEWNQPGIVAYLIILALVLAPLSLLIFAFRRIE